MTEMPSDLDVLGQVTIEDPGQVSREEEAVIILNQVLQPQIVPEPPNYVALDKESAIRPGEPPAWDLRARNPLINRRRW